MQRSSGKGHNLVHEHCGKVMNIRERIVGSAWTMSNLSGYEISLNLCCDTGSQRCGRKYINMPSCWGAQQNTKENHNYIIHVMLEILGFHDVSFGNNRTTMLFHQLRKPIRIFPSHDGHRTMTPNPRSFIM